MRLRRTARDPFVVFLFLGGLIFAAHALSSDDRPVIHVTDSLRARLAEDHYLLTGVAPDADAIARLTEGYVETEILFREALRRDMHLTDARVRERLVERLRFLLTEEPPAPTEAELLDYYAAHSDRYRTEPQITLEHVFFETPPRDADEIRARLAAGEAVQADEFWLGAEFKDYDESVIRHMFGPGLAAAAFQAEIGVWVGPLASPRGSHFIRVGGRRAAQPLAYAQIRDLITEDWRADRRRLALANQIAAFRENYRIEIDDAP